MPEIISARCQLLYSDINLDNLWLILIISAPPGMRVILVQSVNEPLLL